eukprot:TRINITY_DN70689_c0_g1_i1.p1 TRINITY_DN70689_c0_g1~~TRINITY_DN70689_c0_g1_i1.p1  ORF type:complete len:1087 (-),score=322.18 TRINITY_DN70689_c0_g1_i1:443-3703(-)
MPPLQKLQDAFLGREATKPSQPAVAVGKAALLPSELGTQTLWSSEPQFAGRRGKEESEKKEKNIVRVYRWNEFGKEVTTEFDESHFELSGHFESNSSAGHKEFQDRIRCIHFRREGKDRAEIARVLGRSEKFVSKWWQKEEKEVPRPWGVHEYLSKEMGQKTFQTSASMGKESESSTATWWRDVEIKRKFYTDPAIYDEILNNTAWATNVARTRDFSTGASHLKYDKEGNLKRQSNQSAKYTKGTSPAFDKCIQKLFAEYGIMDRTSGISVNWYPDGDAMLGSHRHDCWTALFSFGYERILTIDKTPVLCQDGDLVIFGTQRHGVPVMPEITEGRITIPVFFYPDHLQMKKQWQTLTDPEDPRASRELLALERENTLASGPLDEATWSAPERASALSTLLQLGFQVHVAKEALRSRNFDVDEAAEALLMAGAAASEDLLPLPDAEAAALAGASEASKEGRNRWGRRNIADSESACSTAAPSTGASSSSSSSSSSCPPPAVVAAAQKGEASARAEAAMQDEGCDGCCAVAPDVEDDDAALALRLQLEQEDDWPAGASSSAGPVDDASAALAMQLEEEDRMAGGGMSDELRMAQFEVYEEQMKREDAEDWHGHGDLMQGGRQREHLSLPSMDKTTCYTMGHGRLSEKDFYELLSLHSIRVLYDFRASDHRGDVHAPAQRFSVRTLKQVCKARGIAYKHVALGRETAYGILAHIGTDEAQHALIELVWQAKRRRTAFLGFDEDWRLDHRQVIAEELIKHGHVIKHIDSSGGIEEHRAGQKFPDFILQEEEKLRKLEKMRHAGELQRVEKSAVDRSAEAVASRLDRPADVIDAMEEMRRAGNQTELVQVQRKLARVQRIAEKKGELANKVLTSIPQWILDEAKEQEAWIAQKKAEKVEKLQQAAAGHTGGGAGSKQSKGAAGAEEAGGDGLLVECARCSLHFPWEDLADNDGVCSKCAATDKPLREAAAGSSSAAAATSSGQDDAPDESSEELMVECQCCQTLTPWRWIEVNDGLCPSCCSSAVQSAAAASSSSDVAVTEEAAAQPADSVVATAEGDAAVAATAAPPAKAKGGGWRSRRQQAAATPSSAS